MSSIAPLLYIRVQSLTWFVRTAPVAMSAERKPTEKIQLLHLREQNKEETRKIIRK